MIGHRFSAAGLLLVTVAVGAGAQRSGSEAVQGRAATMQGTDARPVAQRGGANAGAQQAAANRVALERQVRQALARVARRQIGLTDDQMRNLARVDQKFDQQRRELNRDETSTRLALRASMQDSAGVDQNKVAQALDRLIQLQRRRVDLIEAEQKELAGFMTPLQRAQYQALQERLRRRLEENRPAPEGSLPVGPPPSPPEGLIER